MATLKSEVPPVVGTLSYEADAMMAQQFPVQVTSALDVRLTHSK